MKNFNGYPLRLSAIIDYYSSVMVIYKGTVMKKYENPGLLIDFVLSIMNFSVTYISSYEDMQNWDVDMHGFSVANPSNYDEKFIIPANKPSTEVYAFVPILPAKKVIFFSTVINSMIVIAFVVTILISITKLLRISNDGLGVFNIVTMIFGQSVLKVPQRFASRIIYLTIVVSYVKFMSSDFYESILQIKFDSTEVPFESYKDLDKSNFDVYTNYPWISEKIQHNQHLVNMMQRTCLIDNISVCFQELIEFKNIICIEHESVISVVNNLNQKFEHPVIKIAKPPLWSDLISFYKFEEASPYAIEFNRILKKTQETGLNWNVGLNLFTISKKARKLGLINKST